VPWQRASSPFERGAILFRTPDGRVWPYQTGTNVTTTWFDLIFAQPGGGKSVLMNTLNLGTCLTAGVSDLPFIAVIDIGPSSSGLISLIKDALPPEKRSAAVSFRLQMNNQFAINPFDTKLGMRYPQVTERSFLNELLTLLCTPPGQAEPYDGIAQLAGMVVDEMYRWRDDNAANAEPRPYLPRIDFAVDEAIRKFDIDIPPNTYWWDVVDWLFDKGVTYEAGLAQRYAMPTLGDAVAAARRPQIRNLLEETSIGASSEGVIHAFERMITSSVREFPILSTVTKFALNENRICSLDLADVCPQGDASSDRQTAIMYMLARHALVTPWWINEEALAQMPPKYRPYHEKRLREFAETPKRLCYDEFHRTSKTKSVRSQLIRDVREGRKRGIQIVLASQMLDDFDDDMVDLATGVWVLGSAISDGAVDNTQKRFGLTDTARWIMRHKLTGPKAGGAPALLVLGTVDGKYEQHLINTLGPIELWAFSTTAEDAAIRNRLYTRLGAGQARRLLAANFPGGSARNEIKRRIQALADKGETEKANMGFVLDKIVDELIDSTKIRLEDIAPPPTTASLPGVENKTGS
jgi:intracellular multiplication protein IcmB